MTARRPHKWTMLVLGVGCSALFLWLAFRNTDFRSIGTSLKAAEPLYALPFLAFLFVFYWLKSMRWSDLLSPNALIGAGQLFPPVMIGYAGTAVLPMQMGEFVRAFIVSRKYSQPYALVLGSIGMERIFDLLTIVALMGVVLASGQAMPPALRTAGQLIAIVAVSGFAIATVLAVGGSELVRRMESWFRWIPGAARDVLITQLGNVADGLGSIRSPLMILKITVNSLVQWLFMGLCIWVSLVALDIQVPIAGVALVLLATVIGISLPTSPGYVGNIQLAFTLALQPFGVDAGAALAASIFYHVIAYVSVVVVGFLFLHRLDYRLLQLSKDAQSASTG